MFILDNGNRWVVPRTELTFPGHNRRMHEKAAEAEVDHVMADLEDACPYDQKGPSSRTAIINAFNEIDFNQKVVTFRPNNIQSPFFLGDVEAIVKGAPNKFHGIILPKSNNPEDIIYLSKLLDNLEYESGWDYQIQIEALIETPEALIRAYDIAKASSRMAGLIFGLADFAASMGVVQVVEKQNVNFAYAKQSVAVAAKAAGLHAIDNVYFNLVRGDTPEDEVKRIENQLYEKNKEAANFGMDGTWVIHPSQASIANKAFTPEDEQVQYAMKVIDYFHDQGGGAFVMPDSDEFVDEATAKGYLVLLAKAAQGDKVDEEWLKIQAERHKDVTGYDILSQAGKSLRS